MLRIPKDFLIEKSLIVLVMALLRKSYYFNFIHDVMDVSKEIILHFMSQSLKFILFTLKLDFLSVVQLVSQLILN
jgi:hypothetical protein